MCADADFFLLQRTSKSGRSLIPLATGSVLSVTSHPFLGFVLLGLYGMQSPLFCLKLAQVAASSKDARFACPLRRCGGNIVVWPARLFIYLRRPLPCFFSFDASVETGPLAVFFLSCR